MSLALAGCGLSETGALADASAPSSSTDARSSSDSSDSGREAAATLPEASSAHAIACSDLALPNGTATETLYVGGDPTRPWTATCVTAGGVSKTYLPLPTGNVSAYPAGGCATAMGGGSGVVSTYSRVLFDPATLTVDTTDSSGATSTGTTHEVSGNGSVVKDYTVMLFASARSCSQGGPAAKGSITLTGTHFVVAASQLFPVQGSSASGSGATNGAVTSLTVTGYPAGISPCSSTTDYYTDTGGKCLVLTYAP